MLLFHVINKVVNFYDSKCYPKILPQKEIIINKTTVNIVGEVHLN